MLVINDVSMKFRSASGPCRSNSAFIISLSSFHFDGFGLADFISDVILIAMLVKFHNLTVESISNCGLCSSNKELQFINM